MTRLALALGSPFLLGLPAAAHGSAFLPPGNEVFWGGQGGYKPANIADFGRQSGKHPAVFNYFISWRATSSDQHWLSIKLSEAARMRTRPLLSHFHRGHGSQPSEDRPRPAATAFS